MPTDNAISGERTRQSSDEAPHGTVQPARWSSGNKQIFGTAYESYDSNNAYSDQSATAPISKVWFTGAQGVLTEVYWPTLDTPQVRDSQFLVTDGKSFFFEERRDSVSQVEWLGQGIPAFKIKNHDAGKNFEIERTIFTDPDRNVVLQHVRITQYKEGLKFYILHNPAVGNTPLGNSGSVSTGDSPGAGLYAWEGNQAQALIANIAFKEASAGFAGTNDGWLDLSQNLHMTQHYKYANIGDVVLTAHLDIPETFGVTEFDLALGFGDSVVSAQKTAAESLDQGTESARVKYMAQWKAYQATVRDLSGVSSDGGKLFHASVATIKSMEDKTRAGAFVASPAIPWGLYALDWNTEVKAGGTRNQLTVGYHLVWPRDLYQMATSFLAIDDPKSSIASLNYLRSIQFGPQSGPDWWFGWRHRVRDGSFPQNVWIDGVPCWDGLQMDEVAMPIVLAYRLQQAGQINWVDYWDMVKRAGDFIQGFGPWSPQERWEEQFGISPSTAAAQIAGLRAAAEFADLAKDPVRAKLYRDTADAWTSKPGDNIETWTYTTTGGLGNGHYYIRLGGAAKSDEKWDPNGEIKFHMANDAGEWREKDIVDGGFLELVRFGVKNALDPKILETLPEYDESVRVDVPGMGPGFYRYTNDHYNYDEEGSGDRTHGMLWPFLSGERGHYELARAVELGKSATEIDAAMAPYIIAMEKFATPTGLLPEQVWDSGARAGKSTGSATPLGWTHGEYIKLLRSRADRQVFDTIPSLKSITP